ncbi:MAG: XrtN system VIT domain-containing protein [Bacteroidia bacterium]
MEKITEIHQLSKPIKVIGIILLALNLTVYLLTSSQRDWLFENLQLWYLFPSGLIYFIVALFTKKDLFVKSIGLTLLYIACFTLNKEFELFAKFTALQTWLMIVSQVAMLGLSFIHLLSKSLKLLLLFISGVSMIFTLHMAIYLAPAYAIGLVGLIVLGLGFLVFVPLVSFVHYIRLIKSQKDEITTQLRSLYMGVALPLVLLFGYLGVHANFKYKIDHLVNRYENSSKTMSKAMYVRQYLKLTSMQEYLLENNYEVFHRDMLFRTRSEFHKPMGMLASFLFNNIRLNSEETDAIFSNLYEHRHKNNPRFWSGKDVSTDSVKTVVDVFPEYRLAYIQKTINLSYDNEHGWPSTQEAIYTFHMPEGAIGTSLSLWIDGNEEKAALSTKNKVETAYSTIVGREARDPAMMNWKEGNRLVVNVFPVSHDLPRKLKVGFTIPINTKEENCHLNDIYFQGPDFSNGKEDLSIRFHGNFDMESLKNKSGFKIENNLATRKNPIQNGWYMSWPKTELASTGFVFQNQSYTPSKQAAKKAVDFNPTDIILDINSKWNNAELNELKVLFSDKNLWTYNDNFELIQLTNSTLETFDDLLERQFSIFSNRILRKEGLAPERTLVVTKQSIDFPLATELSTFYLEHQEKPFFLYELGQTQHLNSKIYKESGAAHVDFGSMSKLREIATNQTFEIENNDSNQISISQSKMTITRSSTSTSPKTQKAPDHLMRLFNFGLLMEQLKPFYFKRDSVNESQIQLAQDAFIVSPFSSLVCLESAADYERFDIEKPNSGSLGNSKIFNSGGVPEPREWALIGLAAVFFSLLIYKRFF